jgi:RsmE family RNA methyltransferase
LYFVASVGQQLLFLVLPLSLCTFRYVPPVTVEKRLKVFLEDRLSTLVPDNAVRIVAEPDESGLRIDDIIREIQAKHTHSGPGQRPVVLAIGPEGGYMPRELSMLQEQHGFRRVTLGSRILRTDAAVIVLLGLLHDALSREENNRLPRGVAVCTRAPK